VTLVVLSALRDLINEDGYKGHNDDRELRDDSFDRKN